MGMMLHRTRWPRIAAGAPDCITGPRKKVRIVQSVSIAKFIRAIRALPSDKPQVTPGKWYRTQKEHWLGWLSEYHGPGAYGRAGTGSRDAQFAYNHIVEAKMLLWIIEAAEVNPKLVRMARRSAAGTTSLTQKSAAVRKHVPWQELSKTLFGSPSPC